MVFEQVDVIGKGSSSAKVKVTGSSNPKGGGLLAPVTKIRTPSMEASASFAVRE